MHGYFHSLLLLIVALSVAAASAQTFGNPPSIDFVVPSLIPCENHTSCSSCAEDPTCFWCAGICTSSPSTATCNVTAISSTLKPAGWCSGSACDCRKCLNRVFPCTNSLGAAVFLLFTYLFLIAVGSFSIALACLWISERAGRFNRIFASVMGPLLSTAPLLGVLTAAALADPEEQELSAAMETAMGTLAGSTVYICTILWSLSVFRGRCDFDANGQAINMVAGRLTWASLTQSGVSLDRNAIISARIMVCTMLSYFIIQGPSFQYVQQPVSAVARLGERNYALAAAFVCGIALVLYLVSLIFFIDMATFRIELAKELGEERRIGKRIAFFISKFRVYEGQLGSLADPESSRAVEELRNPLRAAAGIWRAHIGAEQAIAAPGPAENAAAVRRRHGAEVIEMQPIREHLEPVDAVPVRARPRHLQIDDVPAEELHRKPPRQEEEEDEPIQIPRARVSRDSIERMRFEREEDVEPENVPGNRPPKRKNAEKVVQPIDAPSIAAERMRQKLLAADSAVVEPNVPFFWAKSILLLTFGIFCAAVFSDAAVTAAADVSRRSSGHPFYISFGLFPLAINIPDALISWGVAGRRRRHFTTFTFAHLYNNATLNNLIGLGAFCFVVYVRDLTWTFSAETIVILISTCSVGLVGSLVRNVPLWTALPIGLLYGLSLVIFRFLEHYAKWT